MRRAHRGWMARFSTCSKSSRCWKTRRGTSSAWASPVPSFGNARHARSRRSFPVWKSTSRGWTSRRMSSRRSCRMRGGISLSVRCRRSARRRAAHGTRKLSKLFSMAMIRRLRSLRCKCYPTEVYDLCFDMYVCTYVPWFFFVSGLGVFFLIGRTTEH